MNSNPYRRLLLRTAACAGLGLQGLPARASTGKVFYGFPKGGLATPLADTVLPRLAGSYTPTLDVNMTYLPGNTTARAFEAVHKGPADGSQVLMAPSSALTLMPHLRTLPNVDPVKAFTPVIPLVELTFVFCIGPAVPAAVNSLEAYLRWVSDTPAKGTYGVPGLGTVAHLVGMVLARTKNAAINAVAYQGMVPLMKDLSSGAQPAGVVFLSSAVEGMKSAALRPLFSTADQRLPDMPQMPLLRELLATDMVFYESMGFYLPAATPEAKVNELNAAAQDVLRSREMAEFNRATWTRSVPVSAPQFAAAIAEERKRWLGVTKIERFTLEG